MKDDIVFIGLFIVIYFYGNLDWNVYTVGSCYYGVFKCGVKCASVNVIKCKTVMV